MRSRNSQIPQEPAPAGSPWYLSEAQSNHIVNEVQHEVKTLIFRGAFDPTSGALAILVLNIIRKHLPEDYDFHYPPADVRAAMRTWAVEIYLEIKHNAALSSNDSRWSERWFLRTVKEELEQVLDLESELEEKTEELWTKARALLAIVDRHIERYEKDWGGGSRSRNRNSW